MKRITIALVGALVAVAAWAGGPKYIFYFIGDGMGLNQVGITNLYLKALGQEEMRMTRLPVTAFYTNYSASSPITDSAAAGTALSTGHKTKNGMLGMGPDTVAVTSIARTLADEGWGVAIATTVGPDDATPGAFYAHVPYRNMLEQVNRQMAEAEYAFIAGASLRGVGKEAKGAKPVLDEFKERGIQIVEGIDGARQITSDKVVMLFPASGMPNSVGYTIDSIPGAPTMAQITRAALQQLERVSPERFFIMMEGGLIDHACHGNDAGTMVKEVQAFDEAIRVAYDFYLAHPDETLIVVTADHETSGVSLGNTTRSYEANLEWLKAQRQSKEQFSNFCKGILKSRMAYTWDDMRQYLTDNMGFWATVPLTDAQTQALEEAFHKTFIERNAVQDQKTLYAQFDAFAALVYKTMADQAGVGFTTTRHSGSYIPVFAIGVGAERLRGLGDNTELPLRILSLAQGR